MLSKALKTNLYKRTTLNAARRAFGTNEVAAASDVDMEQARRLSLDNAARLTPRQLSDHGVNLRNQYNELNNEYFEMLNNTSARQEYFRNLAQPDENDHQEVAKVKNRINKLIDEEIALAGFQDQLSQEQRQNLAADTFDDVATRSNYYFKINENKVDQNLRVYNFNAPGNKYRHPNVILPHEHVHVQKYVDVANLN